MESSKEKIIEQVGELVKQYFSFPEKAFVPGESRVPLMAPTYSWEEVNEAMESLLTTWVTMGKKVQKFEQLFSEYIGMKHGMMVNSGSSANLVALSILRNPLLKNPIQAGEEIIAPACTWSTTIYPIINVNALPVIVDVNLGTYDIIPEEIEKAITPKTRAIMPVHLLGGPCEMKHIQEIADKHSLYVLEDSCESHGAEYHGKKVGSFGDISTFSFFFSHHISCAPQTPILYVNENNECRIDNVEKIYEMYKDSTENIKVISFGNDNKLRYVPPSNIVRHKRYGKRMIKITTRLGRSVDVTEDHSVFVWDKKKMRIRPIKSSELSCDDFIVAPKSFPSYKTVKELDFLSFCMNNNRSRFFVSGFNKSNLKNIRRSDRIVEEKRRDNYRRRGTFPLVHMSDFSGNLNIGIKKQKRNSYMPSSIKVSPRLARFIGFFIAEGSYRSHGITFSFNTNEKEYINDVMSTARRLFNTSPYLIRNEKTNSANVVIQSPTLKIFMKEFLEIPSGARNKRIPPKALLFDKKSQRALLYGISRGDGTRYKNTSQIAVCSKELINDISYLSIFCGMVGSTFRKTKEGVVLFGETESYSSGTTAFQFSARRDVDKDGNIVVMRKRKEKGLPMAADSIPYTESLHDALRKCGKYKNKKMRYISLKSLLSFPSVLDKFPSIRMLLEGDLCLLQVRSIEEISPQYEDVYDFSVPECENFVGGFQPLCLHNSTVEGGMLLTNNEEMMEIARPLRAHGWIREMNSREQIIQQYPDMDSRFLFYNIGFNLRPTDIQGAFGIQQMKKLDSFIEKRRENFRFWNKELARFADHLILHEELPGTRNTSFAYPIVVRESAPFTKQEMVDFLESRKIETRPIEGANVTRHPSMKHFPYRQSGPLNNANTIMDRGFFFGNHHKIGKDEREYVVSCIEEFIKLKT